ncbi:MAG: hypothetical protein DRP97_01280 [Candidatus Latescibacterota bacterium]|nr:MAG: hypothetical protein DRP97_01280 [Candidatus Latescibacterota bacterium]
MSTYEELMKQADKLARDGRAEEAISAYEEAIEEAPDRVSAYYNLALLAHQQGKLDEAIATFEKAAGLDPGGASIFNNLGVLYYSKGMLEQAEARFKKAIELKPGYAEARDGLEAVCRKLGKTAPCAEPESCREKEESVPARKLTLSKNELMAVLQRCRRYLHPEVRTGELILSQDIFQDNDRETNVWIAPDAQLDLTGNITIGAWTMIGSGTSILTHDHYHAGRSVPLLKIQEEKGVMWQDKTIGRDVWLHGCTILYQVTEIPDGVVVGANSVLTRNPEPYEIWAGNPARKVGMRD